MIADDRLLARMLEGRLRPWRDAPRTWLTAAEREEHAWCRSAARRREWLAGRWLLKCMIRDELARESQPQPAMTDLSDIQVVSRDASGLGRPPRALLAGRLLPWHLSLAHHREVVWGAISKAPSVRVGIDVVGADAMDHLVCDLWFTASERRWLRQSRDRLLGSTLWAVKEAVYKATNRGEPFAPVRIEVGLDDADRMTWSREGMPRDESPSLQVTATAAAIVVVASVGVGDGSASREGNAAHD